MDAKTRLIGNAAYIGFFAVAGVALMVYFAVVTQDEWIRLASVAGAVYFSAGLVLVVLVFTHALKRGGGEAGARFTLDPRFALRVILATVALMLALAATLLVESVVVSGSMVAEAIIGGVLALLAIVLTLGVRDYRRKFPPQSMSR